MINRCNAWGSCEKSITTRMRAAEQEAGNG